MEETTASITGAVVVAIMMKRLSTKEKAKGEGHKSQQITHPKMF